jgi:hypothetical protein
MKTICTERPLNDAPQTASPSSVHALFVDLGNMLCFQGSFIRVGDELVSTSGLHTMYAISKGKAMATARKLLV